MANLRDKRFWDLAWDKLRTIVAPGSISSSPFGQSITIDEPFTLFVEETGVTGTLATLRSNSPRVFPLTPNPYGTYVYE